VKRQNLLNILQLPDCLKRTYLLQVHYQLHRVEWSIL